LISELELGIESDHGIYNFDIDIFYKVKLAAAHPAASCGVRRRPVKPIDRNRK